jgi:hypothetical protein
MHCIIFVYWNSNLDSYRHGCNSLYMLRGFFMAILIEEDNSVSVMLLDQTLKKYDYESFIADNNVEALEILSKNSS